MTLGIHRVVLGCAGVIGISAIALSFYKSAQAATSKAIDQTGPSSRPSVQSITTLRKETPHPLLDIASIVEADVTSVSTAYDARLGPRTIVSLSNVTVHAGAKLPQTTFSQLGGPLPSGGYIEVKELPRFAAGSRYILFFPKQASLYTPIWAGLAFRVERLASRAIVLGTNGHVITGFGVRGVEFGKAKLIADSAEHSSPLAAGALDLSAAESDSDMNFALTPEEFVNSAKDATAALGAPIGAPLDLAPPANARWDIIPTIAQ